MQREQKRQFVESLQQTLQGANLVVVAHQTGLSVAEMTKLRRQMREAGAGFKVTKNRLVKLAIGGTQFEGLSDLFTGPTTMAFSADPVAAARVAVGFANTNSKFVVIGGSLGSQVLDANGVEALAKLPSLDELRGKLIGVLQAPAGKLAQITAAPGAQIARVLAAYADKDNAAA